MEFISAALGSWGNMMHFNKEVEATYDASALVAQDNLFALPSRCAACPCRILVVALILHAAFVVTGFAAKYAALALDLTGVSLKLKSTTGADGLNLGDRAFACRALLALPLLVALIFAACFTHIDIGRNHIEWIAADHAVYRDFAATIISVVFALVLMPVDKLGLNLAWVPAYFYGLTAPAGA